MRYLSDPLEVPTPAAWLGGLGAVPFVALATLTLTHEPAVTAPAAEALAIYGAVILSFMGGIQWGFFCSDGTALQSRRDLGLRLSVSVLPALIGWVALMIPVQYGFALLGAAFAMVLLNDLRAVKRGDAPPWYPKLRWPLTVIVTCSLALGAVGQVG